MSKTREVACIHYVAEGVCDLNHKGTFHKACQKCKQYRAIKGGRPARLDLRKQKLAKIKAKEIKGDYYYD